MNYEFSVVQVAQLNNHRRKRVAKGYCPHCNQYHGNVPPAIATMCFAVKAVTYGDFDKVTGIEYISEDEQLRFFMNEGEPTI